MFCSKCGATVADGTTFCQACGNPVSAAPMASAPPAVPPAVVSGMASYAATTPMARRPVSYAGFWLRFVAYLIDAVVIWIVCLPLFLILGSVLGVSMAGIAQNPNGEMLGGGAMAGFALFELLIVAGVWLYFAMMETSAWQGTIGKKVLGLRVTDLDGNRIGFARATGRYFAKLVSGIILMFGYIMAGFTEKKQALHDMMAGCLVVKNV